MVLPALMRCLLVAYVVSATPSWYDGDRVHMHTRMALCGSFDQNPDTYGSCYGMNWLRLAEDHPDASDLPSFWTRVYTLNEDRKYVSLPFEQRNAFWDLAANVNRTGVGVVTRGMKFAQEGPWWPSRAANGAVLPHPDVTTYANKTQGDLAATLLTDAAAQNVRTIAYYRHPDDIWGELQQPEWIARDKEGAAVQTLSRGKWMSLTSGYGDYVVERVVELVERGAAGLYFDERHIPSLGDFNTASQELYSKTYPDRTGGLLGATDRQVKNFRQVQMETFFTKVVTAVSAVADDVVVLISANEVASDTIRRSGGVPKTEINHLRTIGSVEFGCTLLTDTCGGYPHVWVYPDTIHQARTYSRYLAYGCIYNRDVREHDFYDLPDIPARRIDKNDGATIEYVPKKNFTHLFELSANMSPAMESVLPYRKVRIVYNGALLTNDTPEKLRKAYETLFDLDVAVGFYTYRQLEALVTEGGVGVDKDTDVLVFPIVKNYDLLLSWLKPAVDAFLLIPGKRVDYGEIVDPVKYAPRNIDTGYRISNGVKASLYRHKSDKRTLVVNVVIPAKKQNNRTKIWLSNREFECKNRKAKPKAKNTINGKNLPVKKMIRSKHEYFRVKLPKDMDMTQVVFTLCR